MFAELFLNTSIHLFRCGRVHSMWLYISDCDSLVQLFCAGCLEYREFFFFFYTQDMNTPAHTGHHAVLQCFQPTHRCNYKPETHKQIRPAIDSYMLTRFIIFSFLW